MTDTCTTCSNHLVYGVCLNCSPSDSENVAQTLAPEDLVRSRVAETLDAVTYAGGNQSDGAVGSPREPWEPGRVLFDEFEVIRELGRGGTGVVYLVDSRISGQQHAVKRTRVVDPTAREALLTEVQTWKDLPEHPNLTACHFFRTLGDDVVIFAEHVSGGGLDDAIADNPNWDVRTRFELAIQFAIGLEAAHLAGFVHQDVKPGNALMASDGTLKVTDFGLSRTQQLLATGSGPSGLTPAYCSPEQAFRDQPITALTDVWSWAVSVMHLFFGKLRWETGIFAPGVLQLHRSGKLEGIDCSIPGVLTTILEGCFAVDVGERWLSSTALCNALESAWEGTFGEEWKRPRLQPETRTERRDSIRAQTDPRRWLDDEETEIEELGDIGQLALYDRAARRVSAGLDSGQYSPAELGELLLEKGRLHHRTFDWPGALDAFRQARRLLTSDAEQAEVNAGEARVLTELRRFDDAERAYLRAGELFDRAGVDDDRIIELSLDLSESRWMAKEHDLAREVLASFDASTLHRNDEFGREFRARYSGLHANVELSLGNYEEAARLYRQAAETYEDLILLDGRNDLRWRLCTSYFNLATGLTFGRKLDEAKQYFRRSERGLERLIEQPGGRRWTATLAQCLMNFGLCLRRLGEVEEAESRLKRAVGSLERIVHLEGRRDMEEYLTTAYLNLAMVFGARGDNEAAANLCARVVKIRRRKVEKEGRDDVRDRLAAVLGNYAYYLAEGDQNTQAIAAYDESIDIRETLLDEANNSVVRGLSRQLLNRAELHERLGLWDATRADANRAQALLRAHEIDPGTEIEALQMLALVEHRAGNESAALDAMTRAEKLLIDLAESTSTPAHVAEFQVRGLALRVLFEELDSESALRSIGNHPHASSGEKAQACRLMVRWAVANNPAVLPTIAMELERLDESSDIEKLELEAAGALAAGKRAPDLIERADAAAKRTGRYWLSNLASRLST